MERAGILQIILQIGLSPFGHFRSAATIGGRPQTPSSGNDIIAVDLSDRFDPNTDQAIGLYEDLFVTEHWIEQFKIGIGEDTFMCGLFASHHGGERNVPVVRFGNLSMMASERAPVELETKARLPCHLVDTRSRGGFSGSPVFVYRSTGADLEWLPYGAGRVRDQDMFAPKETDYFWGLLGIHCGQFWEPVEVRKVRKKKTAVEYEPILEGDRLEIQSGMTIVIPAWRISDLLDSEVFEMARQKRDDSDEEAARRRPRPESMEVSSASDANPRHLEDFTRLVDVAARKRPQGDQT